MEPEIRFEPFEQAQPLPSSVPWAEYAAVDGRIGRPVRLAVLRSSDALPPERTRACLDWFAEAGYQSQRLGNRGLATVVSYRSTADAAWVATEVPAGNTLRDLLHDHGPLPIERAMEISSRVASILADAHAAGWAHGFLNADCIWVDDDIVTIGGLGLAIAAQAIYPDSAPYSTQRGFLSTDPRRRDMQCLGLLIAEMVVGNLPDPVGVPRTDVFPPSVPAAAVKRIRSLVNPQSEDPPGAEEWAEYALVGEPEAVEAPPPPPTPDTRYYEDPTKKEVSWTGMVTAAALVVIAIAVAGLWLQQWLAARPTAITTHAAAVQATAPTAPPGGTTASPVSDVLTRVQVGPIQPADEEKTVKRLKAMRFQPYVKREGAVLYMQVGAFANADSAKATVDQLQRAGITVRTK